MFNRFMKLGQKKASKPDGNGSNVVSATNSRPAVPSSDQQAVEAAAPAPRPFNPVIEDLPKFKDVYSSERLNLFVRKTQLCCVVCDFTNNSNLRDKEIKSKNLVELVEFIQTDSSKMNVVMQDNLMRMISMNIFRCLPPASYENTGCLPGGSDPEEDEPYVQPAWPHLQFVYELLLRYIVSCDRDIKTAKRLIDHTFVFKLIDLFDSEDPRERDYLKMVLHRIYGKFMVHRPYIRTVINNVFYRFICETERHSGIGELLEILGSIINGFALPMKEEHRLFLVRALLPLHKAKNMSWYHQQLSYCVVQFVEKDFTLADIVIKALLKFWPVTNCQKEVLFLGELEEVLEATQLPEFEEVMSPLFKQIARCLNSSHFQVAERALFLWNNEHLVGLISHHRDVIFPIIMDALEKNMNNHWNQAVSGLTANVRRMFMEMDAELYQKCQKQIEEKGAKVEELQQQRELKWKQLEAQAN